MAAMASVAGQELFFDDESGLLYSYKATPTCVPFYFPDMERPQTNVGRARIVRTVSGRRTVSWGTDGSRELAGQLPTASSNGSAKDASGSKEATDVVQLYMDPDTGWVHEDSPSDHAVPFTVITQKSSAPSSEGVIRPEKRSKARHTVCAVQFASGVRVPFDAIPIIDVSDLVSGEAGPEKEAAVALQIGAACRDVGFFYVKNHGVPDEVIQKQLSESKMFFDRDSAEKKKLDISKSSVHRGYFAMGEECLSTQGDHKEGFDLSVDLEEGESRVCPCCFLFTHIYMPLLSQTTRMSSVGSLFTAQISGQMVLASNQLCKTISKG